MKNMVYLIIFLILTWSCGSGLKPARDNAKEPISSDTLRYPQEKHLANLRQLTFGGDNAEAYFSFDNTMITFQSNNPAWDLECDQIFYTRLADSDMGNKLPQRDQYWFGPDHLCLFYARRLHYPLRFDSCRGSFLSTCAASA